MKITVEGEDSAPQNSNENVTNDGVRAESSNRRVYHNERNNQNKHKPWTNRGPPSAYKPRVYHNKREMTTPAEGENSFPQNFNQNVANDGVQAESGNRRVYPNNKYYKNKKPWMNHGPPSTHRPSEFHHKNKVFPQHRPFPAYGPGGIPGTSFAPPAFQFNVNFGAKKYTNNNSQVELGQLENESNVKPWELQKKRKVLQQRQSLPVYGLKDKLKQAVADNQVLIVVGNTGSGKTTQITQYLVEFGYHKTGVISCTQPRKVAAKSIAKRVAYEYGCQLGNEVGYKVRFDNLTSSETIIKYMTDGMLLRECLRDSELTDYSVIMLDEAHERTISTDILFGLLKNVLPKRPDLKLIATSATLNAEKFSQYFLGAPIFEIPGRTFPVDIIYCHNSDYANNYVKASVQKVIQIHRLEPPGDIMVFLTGQEEIDACCAELDDFNRQLGSLDDKLLILPIYSALPHDKQALVFEPTQPGIRKVIIATNIAETSLTVDGIIYVVDPGYAKLKTCNFKTGMNSLKVTQISQAAANQRSGRAGRTAPGKCYRLYQEEVFKKMLPEPLPEIKRINIGLIILLLKSLGIEDILKFDLIDPPSEESVDLAMEQLHSLSAVDSDGNLTELGKKMAAFPLEPNISKILVTSASLECSSEILTILSMFSVQPVDYIPKGKKEEAAEKKRQFNQQEGDLLSLFSIFKGWCDNNFSNDWCKENFIKEKTLKEAREIRTQLLLCMNDSNLEIVSAGENTERITKAICSGLYKNAAYFSRKNQYITKNNQVVYVHPSSLFFNNFSQPPWVVYSEILETKKIYIRDITEVNHSWVIEFTPKSKLRKINSTYSEEKEKNNDTDDVLSSLMMNEMIIREELIQRERELDTPNYNIPSTSSAPSTSSQFDMRIGARYANNKLQLDLRQRERESNASNTPSTSSAPSSSSQFNMKITGNLLPNNSNRKPSVIIQSAYNTRSTRSPQNNAGTKSNDSGCNIM